MTSIMSGLAAYLVLKQFVSGLDTTDWSAFERTIISPEAIAIVVTLAVLFGTAKLATR